MRAILFTIFSFVLLVTTGCSVFDPANAPADPAAPAAPAQPAQGQPQGAPPMGVPPPQQGGQQQPAQQPQQAAPAAPAVPVPQQAQPPAAPAAPAAPVPPSPVMVGSFCIWNCGSPQPRCDVDVAPETPVEKQWVTFTERMGAAGNWDLVIYVAPITATSTMSEVLRFGGGSSTRWRPKHAGDFWAGVFLYPISGGAPLKTCGFKLEVDPALPATPTSQAPQAQPAAPTATPISGAPPGPTAVPPVSGQPTAPANGKGPRTGAGIPRQ